MPRALDLVLRDGDVAVCRLAPDASMPVWADRGGPLSCVVRSPDEVSVVCRASDVPDGVRCEGPWAVLSVRGPLEFSMVGILAALAAALADAGISLFAVSTFDTDHLLVARADADAAVAALRAAGHRVAA
jgi:hypothetical protein